MSARLASPWSSPCTRQLWLCVPDQAPWSAPADGRLLAKCFVIKKKVSVTTQVAGSPDARLGSDCARNHHFCCDRPDTRFSDRVNDVSLRGTEDCESVEPSFLRFGVHRVLSCHP